MHHLYHTKLIEDNYEEFLNVTEMVYQKLKSEFSSDTTWNYDKYNLFVESSTSVLYYYLYRDLCHCIRDFNRKMGGDDTNPIWMESWLNFHSNEDIKSLDWHGHEWDFHGYVSVDPKNTITVFKDFAVENKTGLIYLGTCGEEMKHRVHVNEPYDGNRITIAFDCTLHQNHDYPRKLIPVL
jgi:hypothetical protein